MELAKLMIAAACLSVATATTSAHKHRFVRSWETPRLPEVRHVTQVKTRHVKFHGHVPKKLSTTCGVECQKLRTTQPASKRQLEEELGFETLQMDNMALTITNVEVGDVPDGLVRTNDTVTTYPPIEIDESVSRRKRSIVGVDTRFTLHSRRFMTSYPFSTTVKISTGCSGILISPKHVLTSAHCIHDGKRYVKGVRKLKVGKQMATVQKRRGKGRKGGKKRRRNKRKNRKSANQISSASREKRDLTLFRQPISPYFKWVRAKKINLPQQWTRALSSRGTRELPVEYDYAVIELRRALGNESMDVGICPNYQDLPSSHRIHFTGFDSDREDEMLYRFCAIEDESSDLMYHYCDAHEGTSGSGIYIRLFDRRSERWSRRVIGVFSGHQFVNFPNGSQKEFNTGVRITPLKYAQICYWTKGSYDECRGG